VPPFAFQRQLSFLSQDRRRIHQNYVAWSLVFGALVEALYAVMGLEDFALAK
jgi:hypothetical protein